MPGTVPGRVETRVGQRGFYPQGLAKQGMASRALSTISLLFPPFYFSIFSYRQLPDSHHCSYPLAALWAYCVPGTNQALDICQLLPV